MILIKQMSTWRFYFVGILLAGLCLALVWHLAHLQVIPGREHDFRFLQNAGEARTLRIEKINSYRGVITDRHGEVLAVSTPVKSIFANPQKLNPRQLSEIAEALTLTEEELSRRFEKYQNKQFMYLKRHMPPHEADIVLQHKFSGVFEQQEFRRYYPAGEVAAHVVGFTDVDDIGREGIELGFENWLAGEQGLKRVVKDLKGNVVKDLGLSRSPKSGNDLHLTIDLRLQYLAYKELKKAIAQQKAKSGSVVIMAVQTGEILAMANQPSYNPNNRAKVHPEQLRNRAFTDVFEPGSTMKPFTVMAALETGRYAPTYSVDTSPGHIFIGGKVIPDPVNYGVVDLTEIITKSSQVGISKLAITMEPHEIRDMYFRSGLGQASGVGFPGESVGTLPNRTKWHPIELVTFAYGYGLSVNAVQLAQAYTVIASGGKFNSTKLVKQNDFSQGMQVVSSRIARQVKDMLKTVVQPGGTATSAKIDAFEVAGKTGTAHKVHKLGYAEDKYIALFAGFAPADKPEIVAVVIINEPPSEGGYSGGKAAAPVFAATVEKALHILRVPPDLKKQSHSWASNNTQNSVARGITHARF